MLLWDLLGHWSPPGAFTSSWRKKRALVDTVTHREVTFAGHAGIGGKPAASRSEGMGKPRLYLDVPRDVGVDILPSTHPSAVTGLGSTEVMSFYFLEALVPRLGTDNVAPRAYLVISGSLLAITVRGRGRGNASHWHPGCC